VRLLLMIGIVATILNLSMWTFRTYKLLS